MKPYWTSSCGRWTVYHGDCLEVLPTLAAGSVDAVVTDPPYGIGYKYLSYADTKENLRTMVPVFVAESRRVAKRVLVFPGVNNIWTYPPADWVISWSWRSTSHFGMAGYSMWQPLLLYGKDVEGFGSVDGVLKCDSLHFPDGNGIGFLGEKRENHPCPKPERVMVNVLRRFSVPDGTVVDAFLGSGTTLVACVKTGRRGIGIEISEEYCEIAAKRIEHEANHLFAGVQQ